MASAEKYDGLHEYHPKGEKSHTKSIVVAGRRLEARSAMRNTSISAPVVAWTNHVSAFRAHFCNGWRGNACPAVRISLALCTNITSDRTSTVPSEWDPKPLLFLQPIDRYIPFIQAVFVHSHSRHLRFLTYDVLFVLLELELCHADQYLTSIVAFGLEAHHVE